MLKGSIVPTNAIDYCQMSTKCICLQETYFCANEFPSFNHRSFPHIYLANAPHKKRGMAIAYKDTLAFQPLNVTVDVQGWYTILIWQINKVLYTIANVYVPDSKQLSFIHKDWKKIQKKRQGHFILCGDFKLVPDISMDVSVSSVRRSRSSSLQSFIRSNSLFDIWRCSISWKETTPFSPNHITHT